MLEEAETRCETAVVGAELAVLVEPLVGSVALILSSCMIDWATAFLASDGTESGISDFCVPSAL
jgi:hypothetical protein